MHKLMDYVCDEMEALEKKVEKGEDLSPKEIEYLGELTDIKKDLLEIEDTEGDSYAMREGSYMGGSYARNGRTRDRMGRYSGERGYSRDDEIMSEIEMLPEHKKEKILRMIKEM